MNSVLFYKVMSGFYDLLDVIYFRKYENSPRKIVNESIKAEDNKGLSWWILLRKPFFYACMLL